MLVTMNALVAACHSAVCRPPTSGGTGGSTPGGVSPGVTDGVRTHAPAASAIGTKALSNMLRREGFDVAGISKSSTRSWEITTSTGQKIRVSGGGSLAKVPRKAEDATMRPATEEDMARLKIPKHWRDVTISISPDGDDGCLARGFHSDTGEPKALYSADKTAFQAADKFQRVAEIAKHLDKIDERVSAEALTSDTDACLMLIRRTGMRPGSMAETHARSKAYGATTLQARHVEVLDDGRVRFNFIGKSGVRHQKTISDPELASAIKSRLAGKAPNDKLFDTDEKKVNALLDDIAPGGFNVKDLRTVRANVVAMEVMSKMKAPKNPKELKAAMKVVAEKVSKELGNKPEVAQSSYINPTIYDPWRVSSEQP